MMSDAIATIHAALDNGVTLIDTAQGYRSSEAMLGKALAGGYRERAFIATKVSRDFSPRVFALPWRIACAPSNVDYVDLYQIHRWDSDYPIEASMETMAQLQEEGKTRYLGVSNFSAAQMARAEATAVFQTNQPRYSLFFRDIEANDIPFCELHGIGILAHSPLAKGLLTGAYRPGHQFPADDERSEFRSFQGRCVARLCCRSRQAGRTGER